MDIKTVGNHWYFYGELVKIKFKKVKTPSHHKSIFHNIIKFIFLTTVMFHAEFYYSGV